MRNLALASLGLCLLATVGCGPLRQAPFIVEPNYQTPVDFPDASVSFAGSVRISVDEQGIINIYGYASSNSGAFVKVSGKRSFKIHGCTKVYMKDQAEVEAFGCHEISADEGTRLVAHHCGTVRAMPTARVEARGSTRVIRPAPSPESK